MGDYSHGMVELVCSKVEEGGRFHVFGVGNTRGGEGGTGDTLTGSLNDSCGVSQGNRVHNNNMDFGVVSGEDMTAVGDPGFVEDVDDDSGNLHA